MRKYVIRVHVSNGSYNMGPSTLEGCAREMRKRADILQKDGWTIRRIPGKAIVWAINADGTSEIEFECVRI